MSILIDGIKLPQHAAVNGEKLYVCKICGRRVPKGDPMFACCEYQQVCGNCYLKEEDRKERD